MTKNIEPKQKQPDALQELEFDVDFPDKNPELAKELIKNQLLYSMLGLAFGVICVTLGFILFLNNIDGVSNFEIDIMGFKSKVEGAAPGVVLFFFGLIIIFITKFKVKIKITK